MLKNGLSGLVLVVLILFVFLNARVAFWVAAGIPVALMATMLVMYMTGQSINMLSLFGIIMALGIVVDDAIVVGEHAEARGREGLSSVDAAVAGARRMSAPVLSASLTTVAAFMPLLLSPISSVRLSVVFRCNYCRDLSKSGRMFSCITGAYARRADPEREIGP